MAENFITRLMNESSQETLASIVDSGALSRYIEGYAIIAGRKMGLSNEQLENLIMNMANSFNEVSANEALKEQSKFIFSDRNAK